MSIQASEARVTAESQSTIAEQLITECLNAGANFRLEAGAGAGKTYSLVESLEYVMQNQKDLLPRPYQRVACLTYTRAARDEIVQRTDKNPLIFCNTLHGFLWEMIRPFQKQLAIEIFSLDKWTELLEGRESLHGISVEYDTGIRHLGEASLSLHHDDIPTLAIALFALKKFRALVTDRFPLFFIDEYQDTPDGLIEAMLNGTDTDARSPIMGFFGDHWQQIYDNTCGLVTHASLTAIDKHSNFRSSRTIVEFLNGLRPELPQYPPESAATGSVTIYHSNDWPGTRLGRNWKGQISHEASHASIDWAHADALNRRWNNPSADTKVLMLTHAAIANELGYGSLPSIFTYNESFAKKEDDVIQYLIDVVEPAIGAYSSRRFGFVFGLLGKKPLMKRAQDKGTWAKFFDQLADLRLTGSVGEVLDVLLTQTLFKTPDAISRRQAQLVEGKKSADGTALPRRLRELEDLRAVSYKEILALAEYVEGRTALSTKHNVKGAEFSNVLVVLGRGWASYDFAKMLERFPTARGLADKERKSYEHSRNLFYVACSRPKDNLVLVFTQELSEGAIATLEGWAGAENVIALKYVDEHTLCG